MSIFRDLQAISRSWKPRSLIHTHLPLSARSNSFRWQCRDRQEQEALDLICRTFSSPVGSSGDNPDVFKGEGRRRVMRVHGPDRSRIIKGFSYAGSLGRQLYRHRLYALDEALGLMLAAERGVSVPNVLSYGEHKQGIRTMASLVVMEDVSDSFHPVEVFRGDRSHGLTVSEALQRVTPLVIQLYHAGCNHVDVHGTAFLLHKHDAQKDKVIDFQFAVFHSRPSAFILAHQLSHFTKASRKDVDAALLDDWASSVLREALGEAGHGKYFEIYRANASKPKERTYARMTLNP